MFDRLSVEALGRSFCFMNEIQTKTETLFGWFASGVERMCQKFVERNGQSSLPYFADYLERFETEIMANITREAMNKIRAEVDGSNYMRLVEKVEARGIIPTPRDLLVERLNRLQLSNN